MGGAVLTFFPPYLHLQKFACNGTVIEHPEYGEVIQLQGDQRKNICQFLTDVRMTLGWLLACNLMAFKGSWFNRPVSFISQIELAKEEQLKVHGF